MTADQKRIKARLEQIKDRAAHMALDAKDKAAANLAEEAAGLGLQLLEGVK
jgi:hypothetical protein